MKIAFKSAPNCTLISIWELSFIAIVTMTILVVYKYQALTYELGAKSFTWIKLFNPKTTLWGKYYSYSCFTDEEAGTQRNKGICPASESQG